MSLHPTRPDVSTYGPQGKFCTYCGRPFTVYTIADGYDTKTGRPLYRKRKECPLIKVSWQP